MGRHRQVKFCSYHITYFEIRLYVGLITIKVKFLLHDDNWPTETAAGTTRGGRGKRGGGRGAKRLQADGVGDVQLTYRYALSPVIPDVKI